MNCFNTVRKTGMECPVCEAEQSIYLNVNVHPNSMYSISGCQHINISGCRTEEDVLKELNRVISELLIYSENVNRGP